MRPTSLLQLLIVALVVVLAPPLAVLISATWTVDRVAVVGGQQVVNAARRVELCRVLVQHLTSMERYARQAAVLGDASLLELHRARRTAFVEAADALAALELPLEMAARLEAVRHAEVAVLDRYRDLQEEAHLLVQQADATALRGRLQRQGALALPVMGVLLAAALFLVGRPLRDLDRAIASLGAGDFEARVRIGGTSDLRALGERVEWLRQRLLAVESDRIKLFQHVSHDLKTPLACVREGAQLLREEVAGPLTDGQRELSTILMNNAADLERRIDALLRVSELRTAGIRLNVERTDVARLVEAVADANRVAARGRGADIEVRTRPVVLETDRDKLRVAIDNLVTNAVKHAPAGTTVRVTLDLAQDGVRVAVRDDGPGFGADERRRVFEAFYRGADDRSAGLAGSGLGLTIAQEYVAALGGEITIDEGPGGSVTLLLGRPA